MKTTTRYKLCRRLGSSVFEKCQTQKFTLSEERRGTKGKGRGGFGGMKSDFGKQLIEKQKVRFTYGITERQLRNYVRKAVGQKGDSSSMLYKILESRLDNVVYRMGLAPTRRAARQLVAHGHATVNGRKVRVPSMEISIGDKISIREGSRGGSSFGSLTEKLKEYTSPGWVTFDVQALSGEKRTEPEPGQGELAFDLPLVFQFYSR